MSAEHKFEIGQYYHFSDETGDRDIYLKVFWIHPNGMVWLKSADNYYEFHLPPNEKGLVQIPKEVYVKKNYVSKTEPDVSKG